MFIESNRLTTKVNTPRLIKWEEVNFSINWPIPSAVAAQPMINSQIDQIVQNPEGDVLVTFAVIDNVIFVVHLLFLPELWKVFLTFNNGCMPLMSRWAFDQCRLCRIGFGDYDLSWPLFVLIELAKTS